MLRYLLLSISALLLLTACGDGLTEQAVGKDSITEAPSKDSNDVFGSATGAKIPGDISTLLSKAEEHRKYGNWGRALSEYNKIITLYPDDPEAYRLKGLTYVAAGELWAAIESYDKSIELSATSVAHQNRGDAYLKMGAWESAKFDYTDAIKLNSKNADLYNGRAIAKTNLGQNVTADKEQACSLDTKYCLEPTPVPAQSITLPTPTPKPFGMALFVNGIPLGPNQSTFELEHGDVVFEPGPDKEGKFDQYTEIAVTAMPDDPSMPTILGGVHTEDGLTGRIYAVGLDYSMTASIGGEMAILPFDLQGAASVFEIDEPSPTPEPEAEPESNTFPISWGFAGRTTTWTEMDLNGTGQNTVTVEPGSTVTGSLSMSHTASSGYCPTCLVQYYVRMNDVFTHCLTGLALPGREEQDFSFTAPTTPGTYYIQPKGTMDYSCQASTSASTEFDSSTLGIVVVAAP